MTGGATGRRRVLVRGVGAITPLGDDWPASRARLMAGETAVAPVTTFDVTGFPSTVAAAIARAWPEEDRRRPLALAAAREAWAAAGLIWAPGSAPGRLGVFLGAESGRASFATLLGLARAAGGGTKFDHAAFQTRKIQPRPLDIEQIDIVSDYAPGRTHAKVVMLIGLGRGVP